MIVKKIVPLNFGPFSSKTALELDPEVTVLTGCNDTGKSCLIKLIGLMCNLEKWHAGETDVNNDHRRATRESWEKDPEVGCVATLRATGDKEKWLAHVGTKPGDEVDVEVRLAPDVHGTKVTAIRRGRERITTMATLTAMPRVVVLPPASEVGETIDLAKPSAVESDFLRLAFGDGFSYQKLADLDPVALGEEVTRAEAALNEHIRKRLPTATRVTFRLSRLGEDNRQLGVYLEDEHRGYARLGVRGAGLRKMVTLISMLLGIGSGGTHTIILFDEPENSLHADAQHALRGLLEQIAADPAIQVVYATHSPSMMNTMRPHSVRLLQRTTKNNVATTIIDNKPLKDNYLPVRASLGISAADSLLYAPVTVIVEGMTEVRALPKLLERLQSEDTGRFAGLGPLLAQSCFLSGEGASVPYLCRVAKSQGAQPVVLVDGDRGGLSIKEKVKKEDPGVDVVVIGENREFENIVPRSLYFGALAEVVAADADEIDLQTFEEWEGSKGFSEELVFSRRVEHWLTVVQPGLRFEKPTVMERAVESADLKDVDLAPIAELVQAMRKALSAT